MATIETNPQLGEKIVADAKEFVLHSWSVQNAINPIPVAGAEGAPIVEYRTGGERERGKTSHPSIQWWLRERTLTAENLTELRSLMKSEGSIVVIARDGRYRNDEQESAVAVGLVTPIEAFGDWEVLRIDAPP